MRYALINTQSGIVENVIELEEGGNFTPPDGYELIQSDVANINDLYSDGEFIPPIIPDPDPDLELLAHNARTYRDQQLKDNYDRGILMVQRMIRMTSDADRLAYLNGKIVELDEYATDLQNVPEQEGFPLTIIWPVAPDR